LVQAGHPASRAAAAQACQDAAAALVDWCGVNDGVGLVRVSGGGMRVAGIGELVTVGWKLGDPGSLPNPAAAAAALAALVYTSEGLEGAEKSARDRRGQDTPLLMEWRRDAVLSRVLQGWMASSLARSTLSARVSAAFEVRNGFIIVGTLASSWIKKTVLNIENKKNRIAEKPAYICCRASIRSKPARF
jgi:hypothetical protein